MRVSVSDSLCFNGAILSLITLWQRLRVGGGVGSQRVGCSASRRREGLKRKKEERVEGRGSGAGGGEVEGSCCLSLSLSNSQCWMRLTDWIWGV